MSQTVSVAVAEDPLVNLQRQIVWNRLLAVVEEQAQTLIRASFSIAVREANDLSAGMFDTSGRMLAQAVTGTPGHVNTMAQSVAHFLQKFPLATMRPGDVFVTNDPWLAAGHLNDFCVVSPAFHNGRPVAFSALVTHLVDVGGRGMGPDGRQVFEEGVTFPIMPLARGGVLNEDLMGIILANTREPLQVEGDLKALIAAGEEGQRRLLEIMVEFGLDDLTALASYIIDQSYAATVRAIGKLPPGTYRNSMTVDGYDAPLTIVATCTVEADRVKVDYTGTSPMSRYGINVVEPYAAAYTCFGLKCAIAPDIPNNAGSLAPFIVSAPPGSILHALRPAPVAARHIIGLMLPDVVFGCLDAVLPGGAQAEGGLMWSPHFNGTVAEAGGARRPWVSSGFFSNGGTGARPAKDGLSTTAFPAGVKSVPVEAAELVSPIVIWRKEFRPDSGGAGKRRGGLGQIITVGTTDGAAFNLQAMFDRVQHPARGRAGGANGAPGRLRLESGPALRSKGLQEIPAGDRLHLELPGGGGIGDARERAVDAVLEDVENGLVSAAAARSDYGIDVSARCRTAP